MRTKPWIGVTLSALVVGISAPSLAAASAHAHSANITTVTTLNLFDDGDTNLEQMWDILDAKYEKANPDIKINLIWNQHGTDDNAIYARMVASIQAGKPDPFDITDGGFIPQGELANEFVKLNTTNVPNLKLINPTDLQENLYESAPYRGSEVVLAYNTKTVKNPPATLAQLISWIQANPGKFDYCNPADGGSGDAFVQAIAERGLSAMEITKLQNVKVYNPKLESEWNANLQFLASLGKDIYRGGYYPGGNTQVLQLLAQGAIQMATVWSDQGTAAIQQGQLPKAVKLTQLKVPLYGSPTTIAVPVNAPHKTQALAFLNWVLEPAQQVTIMNSIAGFPGIEWQYLPKAEQAKFAAVEAPYNYPMQSKYDQDLVADWQKVVAGASANG